MKLAYVVLLPHLATGIRRSLQEKAKAFASLRLNIDVIVINPDYEERQGRLFYTRIKTRLPRRLLYFEYLFRRYRLISESVDLSRYDAVILRYPCADRSGIKFCKAYRIITEHHSDVRSQFLADLQVTGSVFLRLSKLLRYALERRYGHRMLQYCHGMVALTDEIRRIERARFSSEAKAITITNGIDVSAVSKTGYRVYDGKELDIVFIASSDNPWHGLDRLTTSLKAHKREPRITLHVVGNFPANQFKTRSNVNVRIECHGSQTGEELDHIFSRSHVAFSTMGLYRKRMTEACSLKTREYTARGIPFVLGYTDPDLSAVDSGRRFYLQLENNDSPVDLDTVIRFVERMSEDDNPAIIPNYMREYAYSQMDWRVKVQGYREICSKLESEGSD